MLLNSFKKLLVALVLVFSVVTVYAAGPDLTTKYLNRAEDALDAGNIDDAYKSINLALAVTKDEASQANVLFTAQSIYKIKLQNLLNKYDEIELSEIQINLEKYPKIENASIKKLLKNIEINQQNIEREKLKVEQERQRKLEQERFEQQQNSMQAQSAAMEEQAKILKEQAEITRKSAESTLQSNEDLKNAITNSFQDLGVTFTQTAEENKKNTMVIGLAVAGIAVIILIIIVMIIIIVRKGFKQQRIQQEQYVQAVRMFAANQNTTNRLMLGNMTDLYGQNDGPMRLAGTSTWEPAMALPDVEFTEEDQEKLRSLATQCESIGTEIDHITGRKNNSKNVSELVYKLSMQLGLSQGMAMLNFCASMIYDAGYLGMDPELFSNTNLTNEQKEAMKDHVNLAEKHLDFVPKKYWSVFEDAATKHHENMDGTGYPKGLKGDDIPQIARLIRVAESYVSMCSKRAYREAMDKETAISKLREQPQFYDPQVVDTLDAIV